MSDRINRTVTLKCPGCGGELVWNAEEALFYCSWCGSDYTEGEASAFGSPSGEESQENDKAGENADGKYTSDADYYVCSSCGAEIICGPNTAASFCCYCNNPVALKGRLEGDYRPDMIIPFQVSRRQAEAIFRARCINRRFLPRDFLKDNTLEKMTGLYVPFWLCDCDTDAYMIADAIEIVHKIQGEVSEIVTRTYNIDRAAKFKYMGIPADSSARISDELMDAIEPYDYRFFREFEKIFLSGYFCEKYDVDKRQVFPRVKKRVEEGAGEMLLAEFRQYDSVKIKSQKTRIYNSRWRYVLLPVWFMTYTHHGKRYSFVMNGQTGKFAGEFPVSWFKTVLCGIGAAVVAGVAFYLGAL
ncbi:MAG: hypothetical protein K2K57_11000 [Oscillospiraceae bacterium]|nr:hypothetical protein [Oscillospiraceae bacterium]